MTLFTHLRNEINFNAKSNFRSLFDRHTEPHAEEIFCTAWNLFLPFFCLSLLQQQQQQRQQVKKWKKNWKKRKRTIICDLFDRYRQWKMALNRRLIAVDFVFVSLVLGVVVVAVHVNSSRLDGCALHGWLNERSKLMLVIVFSTSLNLWALWLIPFQGNFFFIHKRSNFSIYFFQYVLDLPFRHCVSLNCHAKISENLSPFFFSRTKREHNSCLKPLPFCVRSFAIGPCSMWHGWAQLNWE